MDNIKKPSLAYRTIMKVLYNIKAKSKFKYLGEEITEPSIILCNHVGSLAPFSFKLYGNFAFRFWGTHEMNSGLKSLYNYQTKVYYHQKKGWNLFAARVFCLLVSPLTNTVYKGLNLISTYEDFRFRDTLRETLDSINNGQSIVIFPENSAQGYFDEIVEFHTGFVYLLKYLIKQNIDLPIVVSYYNKYNKIHLFDQQIKTSVLLKRYENKRDLSNAMRDRCNELGFMTKNYQL